MAFALQHGLAPQLYNQVPELRAVLAERFQQNLKRSLLLTSELSRLLDNLPPAIPFKGPFLAQRLYGEVTAREYCDLDLLLRPSDVCCAILALRHLGYNGLDLDPWQLRSHLRNGCEYHMSDGRVAVELHWQFAPRQFGAAFDIEELFHRSVRIRIGDREMPALSPEDDFLMLVVHGTKHAWEKFCWLADLTTLLSTPLDWHYITGQSKRLRIRRMVRVALLLASSLGAQLPDRMREEIARDSETKAVAEQLRDHIERMAEPGKGERAEHRLIAASLDSPADRLAYAARYAVIPTIDDWNYLALPRGTRWLYPAVRLLRLATQR